MTPISLEVVGPVHGAHLLDSRPDAPIIVAARVTSAAMNSADAFGFAVAEVETESRRQAAASPCRVPREARLSIGPRSIVIRDKVT